MSNDCIFGEFDPQIMYLDKRIAVLWGKSLPQTRQMLRDNFFHTELGGGTVAVFGADFVLGIQQMRTSPLKCDEDGNCPREISSARNKPHRNPDEQDADKEPESDEPPPKPRRRGTRKPKD